MSRRDLSQPSFVDAMVSGYGKVGGFLDRLFPRSGGRRCGCGRRQPVGVPPGSRKTGSSP